MFLKSILKVLPFENITYRTRLSPEEIERKLLELVEPKKTFRMRGIFSSGSHKEFEGTFDHRSFEISRIINYRNSFLPRISGIIEKELHGTKITVKMRLHILVLAFIILWLAGITVYGITAADITTTASNANSDDFLIVPICMVLLGFAIVTGGFKFESIKAKKRIKEAFAAEIEELMD